MSRFLTSMAICILGFGLSVSAQTTKTPSDNTTTKTPSDNTKVNQRDKNNANPTADQQKENAADREITRKIRRSLTQDKNLSSYAKNIKVITQDGTVTLRGPVRSEEEKQAVEAKATEVAGASHVKSELQIAAKQSK
jgi:hyperosmotically inducible periplasmic protein